MLAFAATTFPQLRSPPAAPVEEVWAALRHLEGLYPGFSRWFWDVTVPQLGKTRRMFVHHRGDRILAVVIAKSTREERKLCTVWVAQPARGDGLAVRLMGEAMEWLGTDRPLFTVPEERSAEFAGIVGRLGFCLGQRLASYYRQGRSEYVFNGVMRPGRSC